MDNVIPYEKVIVRILAKRYQLRLKPSAESRLMGWVKDFGVEYVENHCKEKRAEFDRKKEK